MSVKLRLTRVGAKKRPFYRVVVTDSRSPRDGRFVEHIGFYDPCRTPSLFSIEQDRLDHWLSNGAQPSDTLRRLLLKRAAAAGAKPTA